MTQVYMLRKQGGKSGINTVLIWIVSLKANRGFAYFVFKQENVVFAFLPFPNS